ncbi:hypothetical protein BU16DRAFT_541355 [Lophium mytilinum]|uniref:F-box domain-containing protein n=1 Tax=Lophium mytilinum TaxID=390894 RepID=A0A6A6QJJ3_9PEZI|nr:hypothetical protein BU16DRAFT_541355 [Lophium mytilinum]
MTFLALPNELVLMIGQYLDDVSLSRLSGVSWRYHDLLDSDLFKRVNALRLYHGEKITALRWALLEPSIPTLRHLLAHNVDGLTPELIDGCYSPRRLPILNEVIHQKGDEDVTLIRQLLDAGATSTLLNKGLYSFTRPPLTLAIREGHFKIALLLIESGCFIEYGTPNSVPDTFYITRTRHLIKTVTGRAILRKDMEYLPPLPDAFQDQMRLIRKLLQLGADPNGIRNKPHDCVTTSIRETVNVLRVALQGAWSRSHEENADMITFLIEHGADPERRDHYGRHFLQHSTVEFFTAIALARPPHIITKFVLRYVQEGWDDENKEPRGIRWPGFITYEAALETPWNLFKAIHKAYEANHVPMDDDFCKFWNENHAEIETVLRLRRFTPVKKEIIIDDVKTEVTGSCCSIL